MTDAVVSARDLSLTFETNDGPVHALTDVNLTVDKGEFVSFIGPSGCGKTTCLRVIADLERPTGGNVVLPQPDGPMKETNSPLSTVRFTSDRAWTGPSLVSNVRERSRAETTLFVMKGA